MKFKQAKYKMLTKFRQGKKIIQIDGVCRKGEQVYYFLKGSKKQISETDLQKLQML
jgi:hypothetical protein